MSEVMDDLRARLDRMVQPMTPSGSDYPVAAIAYTDVLSVLASAAAPERAGGVRTMGKTRTARCQECGESVAVTRLGRLRAHKVTILGRSWYCPGTGCSAPAREDA